MRTTATEAEIAKARKAGIRAQARRAGQWVTLDPGWECHWSMTSPIPTLTDNAGRTVEPPWRVYCGNRLVAAGAPETIEKRGPR